MKWLLLTLTLLVLLTVGLLAEAPPEPRPRPMTTAVASPARPLATQEAHPGPVGRGPELAAVTATAAIQVLDEILNELEDLDGAVFQGGDLRKLLGSRVETARHRLVRGDYAAAASQLRSVLRTTDGCESLLRPDRNDWVADCAAQKRLHRSLQRAYSFSRRLDGEGRSAPW